MYDLTPDPSYPVEMADDEATVTRATVLALVDFQCPLCHQPISAEQHRGHLRIPDHQIHSPIFPYGLGGPAYRVACPASGMPIAELCTGEHRPPPCDDPRCLVAIASVADVTGSGAASRGETVIELTPDDELSDVDAPSDWPAAECTTQGYAYREPAASESAGTR